MLGIYNAYNLFMLAVFIFDVYTLYTRFCSNVCTRFFIGNIGKRCIQPENLHLETFETFGNADLDDIHSDIHSVMHSSACTSLALNVQ